MTNYRTFYNDSTHDPFRGDYAASLAPYDFSDINGEIEGAQSLYNRVLMGSSQGMPSGFLLLHESPNSAGRIIRMYHNVFPFCARLGLPVTQWDGRSFGFHGDVIRGQIAMVEWHKDYFCALADTVAVPTAEYIDQAFAADIHLEHFDHYETGAAGTIDVRARNTVFVPPHTCKCFWETDCLHARPGNESEEALW